MVSKKGAILKLTVVTLCAGVCLAATSKPITVKGSDTMVILAQRWAESFMNADKGAQIQVTGGGSGTGFAALINGTTDICNASRPIKDKEVAKIKEKFKTMPVEIKVAVDGVAVYVHENNPVTELTLEQIRNIYTGKILNWNEVGGGDSKIIIYGRENSSGTYEFFREHVLQNQNYSDFVQGLPGTAAVVNAVSKDVYGIGYGGTAYGKGIRFVKVKRDDTSTAFEPTLEDIRSNSYPVSHYLYMYLLKKPEGQTKKFIDWILSDDGQKVVSEVGYFPLR